MSYFDILLEVSYFKLFICIFFELILLLIFLKLRIKLQDGEKKLTKGREQLSRGENEFYDKTTKGGIYGLIRDTFYEDEVRSARRKLNLGRQKYIEGNKKYKQGVLIYRVLILVMVLLPISCNFID